MGPSAIEIMQMGWAEDEIGTETNLKADDSGHILTMVKFYSIRVRKVTLVEPSKNPPGVKLSLSGIIYAA